MNRKIRIGYFIDSWKPGAGTENQLQGIMNHLDRDHFDAQLFTLRDPVAPEHGAHIPWPVDCLCVDKLKSTGAVRQFAKLIGRLKRERLDIANFFFVDSNLFAAPACYLAGVKARVVNRRDIGYWYRPGLLRILRLVNRLSTHFLVNSHAVKRTVIENERFPAERIEVIYNGQWNHDRSTAPPLQHREIGIHVDAPLVGIVANLRPVKRVDRFIDMAARVVQRIPEAHYVIAGQGELEADLKKQTQTLGLADRVHFLGHVPEVRRLLPLLDVGVLTSESEGLSNALIEYAQAGVAAVAFDVGGNDEVIRHGVNGFLSPPYDCEALAENVATLMLNAELRQAFSSAGRRLVSAQFDQDAIMSQLHGFYERISRQEK